MPANEGGGGKSVVVALIGGVATVLAAICSRPDPPVQLTSADPCAGRDRWECQVYNEMHAAAERLSGHDYRLVDQGFSTLRNGETESHEVQLEAGIAYAIGAVCDSDCADLDLRVFQGDQVVGQDVEIDPYPLVTVVPDSAAEYTIVVEMVRCDMSPCRYGVAIFAPVIAGR